MKFLWFLILIKSCGFYNEVFSKKKHPYYNVDLYSSKNFYDLKNDFLNISLPNSFNKFNGYIKIKFIINKNGNTSNFIADTYNLDNYKIKNNFDVINQLFDVIKSNKWESPILNKKEKVKCFKYYIIKFKNGKIEDILPK